MDAGAGAAPAVGPRGGGIRQEGGAAGSAEGGEGSAEGEEAGSAESEGAGSGLYRGAAAEELGALSSRPQAARSRPVVNSAARPPRAMSECLREFTVASLLESSPHAPAASPAARLARRRLSAGGRLVGLAERQARARRGA